MLGPEGAGIMRETERMVMLNVIDNQWKDHLLSMDHLKEGIGLRGYGQKDPLVEYKKESFQLFQDMMDRIEDETIRFLFFMQPYIESNQRHVQRHVPYPEIEEDDESKTACTRAGANGDVQWNAGRPPGRAGLRSRTSPGTSRGRRKRSWLQLQFVGGDGSSSTEQQPVVKGPKVGRNDPCPCGSGKKYKKCCGA